MLVSLFLLRDAVYDLHILLVSAVAEELFVVGDGAEVTIVLVTSILTVVSRN